MRHSFPLQISILILIMVSGCTLQGGEVANYGIVVEEFVAEPSEVQSDEPFVVKAMIRNTGKVKAENIFVELFNTGLGEYSEIRCDPSFLEIGGCQNPFDLSGEDRERGLHGESKICKWECIAPFLKKGSLVTYNPSIRIYYSYITNAIKPVFIGSQDEVIKLQSEGETLSSQPSSVTEGPVSLDVIVKGPRRFWEESQTIEFPIEIDVRNIGGGVACLSGEGGYAEGCDNTGNWNKVVLRSNAAGITFKECDLDVEEAVIDLWENRGQIVCEAELQVPPHARNIQKNIEITAVYEYFIDKSVSVVVKGTEEYDQNF
ncbi:MAG: hypothetical protein JSV39_00020 [Candidatus Aenigmatarchaeota archaeon]|nr:MAG: hypothetical protein JSV39_00020 [Candidatus Aenigmarchaeota archaeon]